LSNKKTALNYDPNAQEDSKIDFQPEAFKHVFLVMELVDSDMKKLLSSKP
jgi:hypothetical protein